MSLRITNIENDRDRLNRWITQVEVTLDELKKKKVNAASLIPGLHRLRGETLQTEKWFTRYAGTPTEGLGLAPLRAVSTAHYDNVSPSTILIQSAPKNTIYRVSATVTCTEASAGGSLDLLIRYTDAETGVARDMIMSAAFSLAATGNATPSSGIPVWLFNAQANTTISYVGTLTTGVATPEFTIYVVLEEIQ